MATDIKLRASSFSSRPNWIHKHSSATKTVFISPSSGNTHSLRMFQIGFLNRPAFSFVDMAFSEFVYVRDHTFALHPRWLGYRVLLHPDGLCFIFRDNKSLRCEECFALNTSLELKRGKQGESHGSPIYVLHVQVEEFFHQGELHDEVRSYEFGFEREESLCLFMKKLQEISARVRNKHYESAKKIQLWYRKTRSEPLLMAEKRRKSASFADSVCLVLRMQKLRAPRSIRIRDFQILKALGHGHIGNVYLAKHAPTNKLYAVKMLDRREVIRQRMASRVSTEVDVLMQCSHPFVVALHFCLSSPTYLYLVMEYCHGGTFATSLVKYRSGALKEEEARFYLAELLIALEYLHTKGYLYRDLKPANILVDAEGHLRLADFDLATQVKRRGLKTGRFSMMSPRQRLQNFRTKSVVGTMGYIAPEVQERSEEGYGFEADYWSVGCLAYELTHGTLPVFDARGKVTVDKSFSKHFQDFVQRLLAKNPGSRLGAKGPDEIEGHPFFAGIKWALIRNQQPPFKPDLDPVDWANVTGKPLVSDEELAKAELNAKKMRSSNRELTPANSESFFDARELIASARRSSDCGISLSHEGVSEPIAEHPTPAETTSDDGVENTESNTADGLVVDVSSTEFEGSPSAANDGDTAANLGSGESSGTPNPDENNGDAAADGRNNNAPGGGSNQGVTENKSSRGPKDTFVDLVSDTAQKLARQITKASSMKSWGQHEEARLEKLSDDALLDTLNFYRPPETLYRYG